MSRTQAKTTEAATLATTSLRNAYRANANAAEAKQTGVDAGVLIPARAEVSTTHEALSVALLALKVTNEDHHLSRERCQHALAVGMCAATDLSNFIDDDDGSLSEADRLSAKDCVLEHDACSLAFDNLDTALALIYNKAPKLPPNNTDLDFIRQKYEVLVRDHDDFSAATMDYVCKDDPDADSDEAVDAPLSSVAIQPLN